MDLIRSAEAAADALLLRFFDETLEAPSDIATAALAVLRKMRSEMEGGG